MMCPLSGVMERPDGVDGTCSPRTTHPFYRVRFPISRCRALHICDCEVIIRLLHGVYVDVSEYVK